MRETNQASFDSSKRKGNSSLDEEEIRESASLRFYFFVEEGNISMTRKGISDSEEGNQLPRGRKWIPRATTSYRYQTRIVQVEREIESHAMCFFLVKRSCSNNWLGGSR